MALCLVLLRLTPGQVTVFRKQGALFSSILWCIQCWFEIGKLPRGNTSNLLIYGAMSGSIQIVLEFCVFVLGSTEYGLGLWSPEA